MGVIPHAGARRRLAGPCSAAGPSVARAAGGHPSVGAPHTDSRPGDGRPRYNRRSQRMTVDTLPDEVDFVFFVETLPEDGLHRIALAVEGRRRPSSAGSAPPCRSGGTADPCRRPGSAPECGGSAPERPPPPSCSCSRRSIASPPLGPSRPEPPARRPRPPPGSPRAPPRSRAPPSRRAPGRRSRASANARAPAAAGRSDRPSPARRTGEAWCGSPP